MWENSNYKENGIGWPLLPSTDAVKETKQKAENI